MRKLAEAAPPGVRIGSRAWVISEARAAPVDLVSVDPEADRGPVKEYRLSEIGRYLVHPGPVEIRKRLIGCEAHRAQRRPVRWLRRAWAALRRSVPKRPSEVILSGFKLRVPAMNDPDLESHLRRVADELHAFDPFVQKLARLPSAGLAHLIGICEDVGGGYSYLKLQGSFDEKLRYLSANVGREVRVTLHRAHLSEGLFDLRGFPPAGFTPANVFRLLTYTRDGTPAACVLNAVGNLDFRLTAPRVLAYLSLFEHTLEANPDLRHAFDACFCGSARPVRLFFNRQLEVDYSKANLPEIYRSLLRSADPVSGRNLIKPVLNSMQTAVSLSYLPTAGAGEEKLFTQVSILHDLRALDFLRKRLPTVYAEVSRRAFSSEAGRFYLLDSITGATHSE